MSMEFSLTFSDAFAALAPAEQKHQIMATNRDSWTMYGLQLTHEDAEMILQTGREAIKAEELVLLGEDITPRLIHWFLPAGYFRDRYALQVAELTEIFYRVKGELQQIYDETNDQTCMLSDNAILDYMYKLYTCPSCAGDADIMAEQMEELVCGGMRHLLQERANWRELQGKRDALHALCSEMADTETANALFEEEMRRIEYDYAYRERMHQDCFGCYAGDYEEGYDDEDGFVRESRRTYAEELAAALREDPEYLLPSASQEAEWEQKAEEWAELDATAGREQ